MTGASIHNLMECECHHGGEIRLRPLSPKIIEIFKAWAEYVKQGNGLSIGIVENVLGTPYLSVSMPKAQPKVELIDWRSNPWQIKNTLQP